MERTAKGEVLVAPRESSPVVGELVADVGECGDELQLFVVGGVYEESMPALLEVESLDSIFDPWVVGEFECEAGVVAEFRVLPVEERCEKEGGDVGSAVSGRVESES